MGRNGVGEGPASGSRCLWTASPFFPIPPLQPRVREAIDAIRADTSKYERYAADPQILTVLQASAVLHV